MEAARSSALRLSADMIQEVKSYRSKVARPYQSNDMLEGNNAPETTEENKTKTERGGEEGGHNVKLTEEFEKLSGPKKFSFEESMIAADSFARDTILEGGFGDNVACVHRAGPIPLGPLPMPVLVKSESTEAHGSRGAGAGRRAVGLAGNGSAEVDRCQPI
ncbi:hypothetical protein NL676_010157 [Syzygium grande]|nr:hypothetical protein NL676_010157 [Syzygium grande]